MSENLSTGNRNYSEEKFSIGNKRNKLSESSSYDYLINMDDDDMYLPEYLTHSINILLNNKKDITGCLDMLFINPELRPAKYAAPRDVVSIFSGLIIFICVTFDRL